jgi:hypothetical protein
MTFSTIFQYFFVSLSVSHHFKIPEMTLRRKNLAKKHKFCQNHKKNPETDKLSKKKYDHREVIHILRLLIYSELNSHIKSQRYIRFNFGPTNNYFRQNLRFFSKN